MNARVLFRGCAVVAAAAATLLAPARAGAIGGFFPDPCTPETVGATYYTAGTASFTCDAGRLRIVSSDAGLTRWMTRPELIPVVPGASSQWYVFATFQTQAGNASSARLAATFWTAQGAYVAESAVQSDAISGTGGPTQLTIAKPPVPPTAAFMRLEFRLQGPGTLWVGDVRAVSEFLAPISNVVPPTIVREGAHPQALVLDLGTWETWPEIGFSLGWSWLRCNDDGTTCTDIPGASGVGDPTTRPVYALTADDAGATLRARVWVAGANIPVSGPTVYTAPVKVGACEPYTEFEQCQLARDAGFELDPTPFYFTNGPGSFSWTTDAAHGGTHALKIVSTTAELSRWLSQTRSIAVAPGHAYDVSAWLKTLGGNANAWIAVNFWTADGAYIPDTVGSAMLLGTQDWTQRSLHVTAPPGAAYLRVEFRLTGPATLWADDVSVTG